MDVVYETIAADVVVAGGFGGIFYLADEAEDEVWTVFGGGDPVLGGWGGVNWGVGHFAGC